ncbi:MAG: DUF3152 domain-containing protein [Jatrophihabitans sp.]|nr:MAG: DUF3152 domain-containing protein [Jatrophihabitans sp.]
MAARDPQLLAHPAQRSADDVAFARRRAAATFDGDIAPEGFRAAWRDFTRRYGWRAYALPILSVVTIMALLTVHNGPRSSPGHSSGGARTAGRAANQAPPVARGDTSLKADHPQGPVDNTVLKAAALPAGGPYTVQGDGTFQVLPGTSPVVGSGPLSRYSIEVENGITGIDVNQFASLVDATLADPRSWSGHGVSLQRVDSGHIDFHVTLVSVMTVRKLCGYDIPIETSCYIAAGATSPVNRVVINDARWVRGDAEYIGDLTAYREYMINHEDGHALGHEHAHECLSNGLAPTMMQQTIGLKDAATGRMCQANPWPYPPGAKDAPGVEAPDTPQNSEFQIGGD